MLSTVEKNGTTLMLPNHCAAFSTLGEFNKGLLRCAVEGPYEDYLYKDFQYYAPMKSSKIKRLKK